VLGGIRIPRHPSLLVGVETMDDAGVVLVRPDLALCQTIDVFPPVVDDPYWYGRIAAANALSDIYAMGARPVSAVNFVGYPMKKLGPEPLQRILQGSFDALEEADCAMAGGHTIQDEELKFGLAVSGTVHPDRIVRNSTAKIGDRLVLTKPLGSGCLTTALKQGAAKPEHVEAAHRLMARLNASACAAMLRAGAHAATDVTGFGLLGHAFEMAEGSGVTLTLEASRIPILPEAIPYLNETFLCGGSRRNEAYSSGRVTVEPGVSPAARATLNDVQTSGGLLVAVPAPACERFLEELRRGGDRQAAVIGDAGPRTDGPSIVVRA